MPDNADKTQAEAKANADSIEDTDAVAQIARGNVHSEEEEAVEQHLPPPMPN